MSGGFRLRCPTPGEKIDDCLESAGDSDFAEDVLKMCFDGVARQAELVRHLLVRLAENQQIDDFLLPLSQVQLREVRGGQRQGCCLTRSEEHTSELQSQSNLVCRLLLEKKKKMIPKLYSK